MARLDCLVKKQKRGSLFSKGKLKELVVEQTHLKNMDRGEQSKHI